MSEEKGGRSGGGSGSGGGAKGGRGGGRGPVPVRGGGRVIASMDKGGKIRQTGTYRLHEGERVIPKGGKKGRNKKKRSRSRD